MKVTLFGLCKNRSIVAGEGQVDVHHTVNDLRLLFSLYGKNDEILSGVIKHNGEVLRGEEQIGDLGEDVHLHFECDNAIVTKERIELRVKCTSCDRERVHMGVEGKSSRIFSFRCPSCSKLSPHLLKSVKLRKDCHVCVLIKREDSNDLEEIFQRPCDENTEVVIGDDVDAVAIGQWKVKA